MYPAPRTVALLLAVLMKRAAKTRARISDKTLKVISRRKNLRVKFLGDVRAWLEDCGYQMIELDRGGLALVAISALDGAPPLLAKEHLQEEVAALRLDKLDEDALWQELDLASPDADE